MTTLACCAEQPQALVSSGGIDRWNRHLSRGYHSCQSFRRWNHVIVERDDTEHDRRTTRRSSHTIRCWTIHPASHMTRRLNCTIDRWIRPMSRSCHWNHGYHLNHDAVDRLPVQVPTP